MVLVETAETERATGFEAASDPKQGWQCLDPRAIRPHGDLPQFPEFSPQDNGRWRRKPAEETHRIPAHSNAQ